MTAATMPTTSRSSASSPKVLLVGLNETTDAPVTKKMREAGLRVVRTDNPLLVPHIVANERPTLLLINAEMPAISGEDVVTILQPSRAVYPYGTFLYSAKASEMAAAVKRCGADGWFSKSAEPADVVDAVSNWVGTHGMYSIRGRKF